MMTRARFGENDSPKEVHKQVIVEVSEKSSDDDSSSKSLK